MNTLKVLPVDREAASAKKIGPDGAVVRYRTGAEGGAMEAEMSDTDLVAPLKNDSLPNMMPIGDPGFLDKPMTKKPQLPPLGTPSSLHRSQQQPPRPGTLKRMTSMQELLNTPGQSKRSILAKQNALIEKHKAQSKRLSIMERAAYFVDQYISTRRGQTLLLACIGLVLTLIGGCILKASEPSEHFSEMIWTSWTFLGDAGSHTALTEPVRTK